MNVGTGPGLRELLVKDGALVKEGGKANVVTRS